MPKEGRAARAAGIGLERLFEYLKRSLSIAWKSVFFNFRQYVSFFAALFIIQTFYGLIAVSNANNNKIEYQHVQDEYDYHMVLRDLNEDQYLYLVNNSAAVFKNDTIFKILRYEENRNYMSGQDRYDMYLFFVRDKDISCDRFYNKYLEPLKSLGREGEAFVITETPLLRFEHNEQNNLASFIFTTLLLLAVSIFLLTALYNIRVNQYKFTYGVYMTFGADFKKLFGTAFWELFVISVVTLIPSMLVSTLAVYLIYLPSGFAFHFSLLAVLEVAIFNLVVVLVSVWMPMRIMAIRQPMTLIVTEDNSNLVTSPMRSINLMKGKFPTYYEFCSIWRFRKYSVQLLTTAIVFCALFICGLYYADIDARKLDYPRPQFTVDLTRTGFAYDDEMSADLYAIPGITEVKAVDNNIEAMEIASHMVTSAENVRPFSNQVIYKSESNPIENHRVTNEVLYTGLSEEQIRILEKYEYTGDLTSIFKNPGTVIIGDSISNVPTYRFEVGDTIQIAIKTGAEELVDVNLSGRILLKEQIESYSYEYMTFTVGAVLHDIPSGSMPIFFHPTDYKAVTGRSADTNRLEIYVDPNLSSEQAAEVDEKVRDWGRLLGEVGVTNTHQLSLDTIVADKHQTELYTCIAVLILFISPLVWFFSQTLYYFKREKEFNILQSLGATVKDIRHIYLQGGLVMATLSLLVSILLSYGGSYALFYAFNVMAPYFTHEIVRYPFYMPWYAILTAILMSVGCGFFSTYLPFRSYIKSRFTLENGGAGDGDE